MFIVKTLYFDIIFNELRIFKSLIFGAGSPINRLTD